MKKAVNILSTKKLDEFHREQLTSIAEVVDYDVLEVVPLKPEKLEYYKNIIFTSYKATLVGLELLGERAKNYHFFCVGKKSEQHLKELGFEVYGFANYSKDLGQLLVENLGNSSFSYLCSADRLDTLPHMLSENNIIFEEIYTYKTDVNSLKIDGEFDIYLWFSPKGVNSLKDCVAPGAIHICIGETTALEATKYFEQERVIHPETPSLQKVIDIAREQATAVNSQKCAEAVSKR